MSTTAKKSHLESLRGLAALSVAVYHFRIGSVLDGRFTDNAWLMVDFFFVLSGYVIALNYSDRIASLGDIVAFQTRRFFRLYPLHLLTLFVWLFIEIAKFAFEQTSGVVANNPAFSVNNFGSFVQNLFLVQNLLGGDLTWNYPSWSISSEFYTYLVFALVLLVSAKARRLRYVLYLPFIVFAASKVVAFGLTPNSTIIGFYRCLLSFFTGALVYAAETELGPRFNPLVAAGLLVAAIAAVTFGNALTGWQVLVLPALFAAVILSLNACPSSSAILRFLSQRWLVYLGTISYGIYMIHAAVWWVFTQVLRFVFKYPMATDAETGKYTGVTNEWAATGFLLLGLVVILLLAHLSYRYFEQPIMRRSSGLAARRVSAAAKAPAVSPEAASGGR